MHTHPKKLHSKIWAAVLSLLAPYRYAQRAARAAVLY